ncbi:TetR/AcrR family transcriptional regulator [Rouxiella badensis]|jgi:AcrR family transcriptional regulator|uniref:TetR family transcriptional regulator n=1 Tax=Rouxiella badensis TaxID=1646377 RepID=A0A1X0WKS6_9GAMM|nr:TetR/AcrR family transcriptional regulator [Rouxiella badensis]MCC3701013.1 TetR/AcrR family transcriptional regulator [Rouxiella badensis]MCC3717440.1 TetR/AcrR family transcriptional regulator [Rouxiella badensis]MCC3727616.1 TetR/AcrR family transcriptional regulator [Rouxiella badensis]MCC3732440.1 TetR/AcrR family transcriptional regulator [Rouxiella badensis]MCC3740448.1 TetR/AcrR family transcriptional regulator [Rouxiella badensis]
MSTEQTALVRKSRGRPKQFDRGTALSKALNLFWRHGYEATSLADLVEATGAKAPTLYAEFGNKEGLFRASVEHYLATFYEKSLCLLSRDDLSVEQAVEQYLRTTAEMFTDCDTPSGCFIINAASGMSAASQEISDMLRSRHLSQERTLFEFFEKKKLSGEFPNDSDSSLLAKYVATTVQGMSVQSRDGASNEQLGAIIDLFMYVWPQLRTVPMSSAIAH